MNTPETPAQPAHLLIRMLDDALPLTAGEHDYLLAHHRSLYAQSLHLPGLDFSACAEIIVRLLAITDAGINEDRSAQYALEDAAIAAKFNELSAHLSLDILNRLVQKKVNNARTSCWIRSYVLGHPDLETLAVGHRRLLRNLLTHALGQRTARTCVRLLTQSTPLNPSQEAFLRSRLYRFHPDTAWVREAFLFLFGKLQQSQRPQLLAYLLARYQLPEPGVLPLKPLIGLRGNYHPKVRLSKVYAIARMNREKREDADELDNPQQIVSWMRRWFRNGHSASLETALEKIAALAAQTPPLPVRLALVLDASWSMRGFGNRLYNAQAITVTAVELLKRICTQVQVFQAGGTGDPIPQPEGSGNLALTLAQAIASQPDAVLILTDGYENCETGDITAVLAALRAQGNVTPVMQLLPVYSQRDATGDRILPGVQTVIRETGENQLAATVLRLRLLLQHADLPTILQSLTPAPPTR